MPFITAFIFGLLAASLAVVLELTFFGSNTTAFNTQSVIILLGIVIIEESVKYLLLRQYAIRFLKESFLSLRETFIIGIAFGVGFAALETGLILWNDLMGPLSALVGIVALHSITSSLFALSLLSGLRRHPRLAPAVYLAALAIHALYNALLAPSF